MSIESKIQSVKDGSAATSPYTYLVALFQQINDNLAQKTLQNNGSTSDGDEFTASTHDLIERAWNGFPGTEDPENPGEYLEFPVNGFLDDVAQIAADLSSIRSRADAHYSLVWSDSENMNYKNRPGLLNGVKTIRANVAIQDAASLLSEGEELTEQEKQDIIDETHNDEYHGTISFQQDSKDIVNQKVQEAVTICESIPIPVVADEVVDVENAQAILGDVSFKIAEISSFLGVTGSKDNGLVVADGASGLYEHEILQFKDSLEYATAYGAVMYAEGNPGDIVTNLMGNLP